MSVGIRIVAVVLGGLVVLAGLLVRSFEAEYDATYFDVVQLGDGSFAAFEADSGDWPIWAMETEDEAADRAIVVRRDSETSPPEVVFAGTVAEAEEWSSTHGRNPMFVGSRQEVDAWMAGQERDAEHGWQTLALIVGGALIAMLGLAAGLQPRSRPA